jgi:hypothetical protein
MSGIAARVLRAKTLGRVVSVGCGVYILKKDPPILATLGVSSDGDPRNRTLVAIDRHVTGKGQGVLVAPIFDFDYAASIVTNIRGRSRDAV